MNPNQTEFNTEIINEKQSVISFSDLQHNNDLCINYEFESSDDPLLVIQQDPMTEKYAFHLSFTPEQVDTSDWEPKGEFAILLDRNGSMDSDSILLARKAVFYS